MGVGRKAEQLRVGLVEVLSQLVDSEGRIRPMNHRMAVGADRYKIRGRIQFILPVDLGQGNDVVHVDVALADLAEHLAKVESAGGALMTVMRNASSPGSRTAFVRVD